MTRDPRAAPATPPPATRLRVLGEPRWVDAHGAQRLRSSPGVLLLTYLAAAGDWVQRAEIAELLWADVDPQDARNNLRQLLHRCKNAPWFAQLETTGQALRLIAQSDLGQFRHAFERADWGAAVDAYGGTLLEGVQAPIAFENWLETERATLHNDWREALIARVAVLETRGDVTVLPGVLARLLDADPYNDEAMHSLLKLAKRGGDVGAALRQFERYSARLGSDLGAQPHPETARLAAELAGLPAPNLGLAGMLLGRDAALREVIAQLSAEPGLVTVRGPGGVGKTALARAAFEAVSDAFEGGATWVSLREVQQVNDAPRAIATALRVTLNASGDPWAQIGDALRHRRALLALDNAEHLSGLAERLHDLTLEGAQLTLLVTSRQALGLPEEWVLPLTGLEYPDSPDLPHAHDSSAVQLFVQRAARRRGSFSLNAATLPGILRICAAVDGLPLGLELAAAWCTELSPEAIADGLEMSADISATPELSLPDAHRSLRAVFEHSWELLDDDLRAALSALSVFQGGWSRRAALEGVGVSARSLLALTGRSLVNTVRGGRFELHPVVRAFAAQKLSPEALAQAQRAHAEYFARFAEAAESPLRGGADQAACLEGVSSEHRNLLAVLENAADAVLSLRVVAALGRYWYMRGHMLEGLRRCEAALEAAGDVDDVALLARTCLAAGIQGNFLSLYARSNAHLERAGALAREAGLEAVEAEALNWRGANSLMQGQLEVAGSQLQTAMAIQRRIGDEWALANTVNDLGRWHYDHDDLVAAWHCFQESLVLAQRTEDQQTQAIALQNSANALTPGDERIMGLIEQSLEKKRKLGNLPGVAMSLHNLGSARLAAGDHAAAKRHLLDALKILLRVGKRRDAAFSVAVLAEPFVLEGEFELALTLYGARAAEFERLGAVIHESQRLAELELELQARAGLVEARAEAAYQHGRTLSLEAVSALVTKPESTLEPRVLDGLTQNVGS